MRRMRIISTGGLVESEVPDPGGAFTRRAPRQRCEVVPGYG